MLILRWRSYVFPFEETVVSTKQNWEKKQNKAKNLKLNQLNEKTRTEKQQQTVNNNEEINNNNELRKNNNYTSSSSFILAVVVDTRKRKKKQEQEKMKTKNKALFA